MAWFLMIFGTSSLRPQHCAATSRHTQTDDCQLPAPVPVTVASARPLSVSGVPVITIPLAGSMRTAVRLRLLVLPA